MDSTMFKPKNNSRKQTSTKETATNKASKNKKPAARSKRSKDSQKEEAKVAEVIRILKNGIISGHFKQGDICSEKSLMTYLKKHGTEVSRMPIRQAIVY